MEASIAERQIRNFIRLLQCASKFGDDLNMHANKDAWELAVTNSTKSAFCLFKLSAYGGPSSSNKGFFSRYKALGETSVQQRRGVKCSLLVKSVLAVLGKTSSGNIVERLDLKIIDPDQSLRAKKRRLNKQDTNGQDDADYAGSDEDRERGIEAILIMKLVCRHGVTKKHSLHLGTSDFLRAEVNPDSTPSGFGISAKALRDMLDHFSIASSSVTTGVGSIRNENQLGWMFRRSEVRVKSWEGGAKDLSTEIKVDPEEFEDYAIEGDRVDLTLPMKEFRAALTLAEQLGISLTIAFSEATQPLTLTSTDDNAEDGFTIFCAIATTTSDAFADVRHTASNSVSAVGPDRKVTRTPSAVDQPTGSRRNRPSSEQPRKRPSLDFGGNLPAAVVVNSAPAIPRTGRMQEPLFLPSADKESDSQAPDAGPSDYGETVPFPPMSQKIRMSQKEVMEASGLGDLGSDELFNELDDAEEEEERLGIGMGGIDTTGGDEEGTASRTFPLGETGAESMIQRDLPTLDHDAVDEDPLEERLGVTEDNELEADDTQELPPSQSEPNHREFPLLFDD